MRINRRSPNVDCGICAGQFKVFFMEELEIKEAESEGELSQCLAVRRAVFVEEMGVPEDIEVDECDALNGACTHFLMLCAGRAVGTFRCHVNDAVHLQRLCILAQYRGRGFGRAAIACAEKFSARVGAGEVELHAKCGAAPFYTKCGYTVASEIFYEAGVPHVRMVKKLL